MSTAFNYRRSEDPEPEPGHPRKISRIWRTALLFFAGLTAVASISFIILGALINTDGVHRAVLNFAQEKATESLGVRVSLQNFALHWSTLSLDLYGISADGAGPRPSPPLLQIQHLELGVRIDSVLRKRWHFETLRLDRPIVWIYVDQNGGSNLPTFNTSQKSGGNNTIIDLGIRHAILTEGQIYYNKRPATLTADLRDLTLQAAYDASHEMYSGMMGYRNGHLQSSRYQPIPHNLDVAFTMTRNTFELKQATLSSGNSQILLTGTIEDYQNNPAVQAQYHVSIDGGQMAKLLDLPELSSGFIRASGNLQYRQEKNQTPLKGLVLAGDLASDGLVLRTGSISADISSLEAHYSVANRNASLKNFRAGVLGGEITAQGTVKDVAGNSSSNFTAAIHDISLAQLKRVLGNAGGAAGVGLSGTLNANATAVWGRTIDDVVAKADASIHAGVSSRQAAQSTVGQDLEKAPKAGPIPVDSELHATYTKSNDELHLAHSYLRTRQTDLDLSGTISRRSSLSIRLQAKDLREIASVVNAFRAPGQQSFDLAGTASFQGNIQGSTAAPNLTGQLVANNLRVNSSEWKAVRTGVDLSPDHAALQNADLEPAGRGRITLEAHAGLKKWSFANDSPLELNARGAQIDLQDLAKLAGHPVPITGTLNTDFNVRGSMDSPEGSGTLTLADVTAYQQPIHSVRIDFSGSGTDARANVVVQFPGGNVRGDFTVQPKQRTYTAQLSSSGIQLDQLEAFKVRNIKAAGMLELSVNGRGSFDNPQFVAAIHSPDLSVANQTISGVNLQVNMANHVANATLNSSAMNSSIRANAKLTMSGDYAMEGSLNTSVINLQPLLALYSPEQAQNLSGAAQVNGTVRGPLKDMRLLEAHFTIPVLKMAYRDSIQLAAIAPIQLNYRNGMIDVPEGSIRGTGTDITFQGHVPTANNEPMAVQLRGTIDMKLAQLFDPDVRSSGQIKLNIDSHGMLASGNDIGGEIDVVDANITQAGMPVGLQNANGVLKLTTDRLNIASFRGTIGGGSVEMRGGIAYRPNLVFDLGLAAKGVRILYPQGMRESLDADLRFAGITTAAQLAGNVSLANLSLTPGFDLSAFTGQFSSGVASPPAQGIAQNVKLNVAVHSSNNVNLVSREVSINGSASLQIRGTVAEPVILGRVNLTGGDIILNGNRFVLTGGTVQFVNPSQTEPVVNLALTTTIQEYNISLRFRGPVEQMKSEYTSDPALPTADVIHLLAFGSTTEAAANNATPANQQAQSLVASEVSSQVTSRISKIVGISQLSVSPVLQGGTTQGPPGANITIRQRVTSNLFITFSTNVSSVQGQTVQGQYQLSPKVAISGTRTQNGGFGFDTLIKKSW
jgi:translocation and assembly module TamB